MSGPAWTAIEAERQLDSLERFGMRFGLDRMRRLMTALGHPQDQFDSIHVVGTNGKSSTARMIAALLSAHDRRTGAYLSPHLVSWRERVRVAQQDLDPDRFAAAVQRAARAAELVDRTAAPGDTVTQFELATAAAYSELAERGVDVAVIEAGLGGRYDATNVLPSSVQVLTAVGLEHTRWLGSTELEIAREKLAVVRDGGTLVVGALSDDVAAEAEATACERGARLIVANAESPDATGVVGAFQRRNFAVARAAAAAYLGALDAGAVREAVARLHIPGRLEVVEQEPLTVLDGAHNPPGVEALVEALPELGVTGDRPLVAVVSILDDKDARAMLAALLPRCAAVVLTRSANPRSLAPSALHPLADELAAPGSQIVIEEDARQALACARSLAGQQGAVLATGSLHLVGALRATAGSRRLAS